MALARLVRDAIAADRPGARRPIIAVVDVPSQAYGRLEALLGISYSLAAAVDAYASARMEGHPVVGLIVGSAISGGSSRTAGRLTDCWRSMPPGSWSMR